MQHYHRNINERKHIRDYTVRDIVRLVTGPEC